MNHDNSAFRAQGDGWTDADLERVKAHCIDLVNLASQSRSLVNSRTDIAAIDAVDASARQALMLVLHLTPETARHERARIQNDLGFRLADIDRKAADMQRRIADLPYPKDSLLPDSAAVPYDLEADEDLPEAA